MLASKRSCPRLAAVLAAAWIGSFLCGAGIESDPAETLLKAAGRTQGILVHWGCGDGALTLSLAEKSEFLVHALEEDGASAKRLQQSLRNTPLQARVFVEETSFKRLPYADNLISVLIVDDANRLLSKGADLKEAWRTISPFGALILGQRSGEIDASKLREAMAFAGVTGNAVKDSGTWVVFRKAKLEGSDDWTQFRHGADRNPVSRDTRASVPNTMQWVAGPEWPKGVTKGSNTFATLSSDGRIFYVTSNALPNYSISRKDVQWYLVARDAFNGFFLWERKWEDPSIVEAAHAIWQKELYRLTPVCLMVAGERLYAGLEKDKLVVLEAATGRTIGSFDAGVPLLEVAFSEGTVFARTGSKILAMGPGLEPRWEKPIESRGMVFDESSLFSMVGKGELPELVALRQDTGDELWRFKTSELKLGTAAAEGDKGKAAKPSKHDGEEDDDGVSADSALVRLQSAGGGVLILCERTTTKTNTGVIHVVSARDGALLWKSEPALAFREETMPFIVKGLIWLPTGSEGKKSISASAWQGHDPLTGKVTSEVKTAFDHKGGCGIFAASENFLVSPKKPEFMNFNTGEVAEFPAGRSPCTSHLLPANGFWYQPPHGCACDANRFVHGYVAFGTDTGLVEAAKASKSDAEERRIKGPAFEQRESLSLANRDPRDWPTYRHDANRSGLASCGAPGELSLLWETRVEDPPSGALSVDRRLNPSYGDPITAPVVAGGLVFTAAPHSHRVFALDTESGAVKWEFLAGGSVDSPPTLVGDACLFGSHDGWIYCLRASDGELVWRYRIAPIDRRIATFGQLASPWKAAGSVMAIGKQVYASAGWSSAINGGYVISVLDIRDGKVVDEDKMAIGKNFGPIFSSNGSLACLGNNAGLLTRPLEGESKPGNVTKTKPQILMGSKIGGFLSGGWRRTPTPLHSFQHYWDYEGTQGQILVIGPDMIYGFHETKIRRVLGGKIKSLGWNDVPECEFFAVRKGSKVEALNYKGMLWNSAIPLPAQVEALAGAGETLIASGSLNMLDPKEGFVWIFRVGNDKGPEKVLERTLPSAPVFDGIAVARERLYVASQNGTISCYGAK